MTRPFLRALTAMLAASIATPVLAGATPSAPRIMPMRETRIDPRSFKIIDSESGNVNYYSLMRDDARYMIRSYYRPGLETVVLGAQVPEHLKERTRKLRWSWRALALPNNGNECRDGAGDSAAVVYVTFKRGLKWYSLKYVWSSVGKKGEVCDRKRNPFRAQDTIILESGNAGEWRTVEIDPATEFRKHFEDGNPHADVPDLVGIAIMSDGDQTRSPSAADYTDFVLVD